jgi:hypothetical protein
MREIADHYNRAFHDGRFAPFDGCVECSNNI